MFSRENKKRGLVSSMMTMAVKKRLKSALRFILYGNKQQIKGNYSKVNNNKNCCEFSILQSHDPNIFVPFVMIFKDAKTYAFTTSTF